MEKMVIVWVMERLRATKSFLIEKRLANMVEAINEPLAHALQKRPALHRPPSNSCIRQEQSKYEKSFKWSNKQKIGKAIQRS